MLGCERRWRLVLLGGKALLALVKACRVYIKVVAVVTVVR